MPEVKPFRWPFFVSFPLVVVAIWAIIFVLAHVQRHRLIAELNSRIASGSIEEATAALKQMARMPEPPLDSFVIAAASPSRDVAREAQQGINELLRKWRRQVKVGRNASRVAARLERLAASLADAQHKFSSVDFPWLAKTAERIVRLANMAHPADAPTLAVACDTLLNLSGGHAGNPSASVIPVATTAAQLAPASVFSPPSPVALESLLPIEEHTRDISNDVVATPQVVDAATPRWRPEWSRALASEMSQSPLPRTFYRRHRAEIESATPIPTADSTRKSDESVDPWASIDSRVLFERWLATSGTTKLQIERELRRRGFGGLRSDVVRLALSDNDNGRVQLVHDLIAVPGVGAKAWLMMFADDENAEVRLAAVTVMATSNDPVLLEKAWQVALHDHDPRIAGLAERLRSRRESPLDRR